MLHKNVAIAEEFVHRNFDNYDAYGSELRKNLAGQRHVDIRTFESDSKEDWNVGSYGTAFSEFPGITITLANELITTTSTMVEDPVDILTEFEEGDFISMALPSFPLAKVNTALSFLDFTSNNEGNFTTGPTASVALNASIRTLVEGNSEFRVPRSAFETEGINLEGITAVRLRVRGTGTGTFIAAGLRLLAATWQYASSDYNNRSGRWRNTIPVNGNAAAVHAFTSPLVWRSGDPSGADDPRPIDANFGIMFYTGSLSANNSFTLYLRETSEAFLTQLDLDGTHQSELDGKPQPDLGISEYSAREIQDLDGLDMEELDERTMTDIERVNNPSFTSWEQFQITWGLNNTITLNNSSSPGYIFSDYGTLNENARYLFVVSLENTAVRARLYEVKSDFSINPAEIFDTTLINDGDVFKRRGGRIGWQAVLGNNDSYIEHIRPRGLTFAEYRSAALSSRTPVAGAQIYANFTENTELYELLGKSSLGEPSGSTVARDTARSTTGESYRLDLRGTQFKQGFQTNQLDFTDFSQAEISFDIWYPSTLIEEARAQSEEPGITLELEGLRDNPAFHLVMPEIQPDQWQHISGIDLSTYELNQTGPYTLQIIQGAKVAGSFWIDNVSIFQRAIQWSARSVVDNPWRSNEAPWTDFRDVINTDLGGITFSIRGTDLQMRAKALRQDATIVQAPKLVPRYAELGRLVWPENKLTGLTPPTANYGAPSEVKALEFKFSSTSTAGSGAFALYEWSFGDGNRATGPTVTYTYLKHGTYNVTLTVTDRYGQQSQKTEILVV